MHLPAVGTAALFEDHGQMAPFTGGSDEVFVQVQKAVQEPVLKVQAIVTDFHGCRSHQTRNSGKLPSARAPVVKLRPADRR